MLKLIPAFFTFFCVTAYAEILNTTVHSIDVQGKFLRFSNGQVGHFKEIPEIQKGDLVAVELDAKNYISSIKSKNVTTPPMKILSLEEESPQEFAPTLVSDMSAAQTIHDSLNSKFMRRSECADRAHVWAYQMFKEQGINSRKAFIFFTASYINRVKFKWWYHVAPMIDVLEKGIVQQKILDFMLIDRPVSVQEWANLQVFSKRSCKMTTKFSEYDVNPQTEDCYMIYESMYYRLPGDIYDQETQNKYRNSFIESEVNYALKMSFKK